MAALEAARVRPLLLWCTGCNKEQPTQRKGLRGPRRCMVCRDIVEVKSKYSNVPTRSKHTGRLFQSRKEANREPVLLALANVGEIVGLTYQQPFRLDVYGTPAVEALLEALGNWLVVTEPLTVQGVEVKRLARDVERSRQCVGKWIADYSYTTKAGELIVEDVKSVATKTPVYRLKKKLVSVSHGLDIQEPGDGGVQQRARGAGISGRGTGARLMGGGR